MKEKAIQILLIEHSSVDIELFKQQLSYMEGLKHRLVTAKNLKDAELLISVTPITIIITDLELSKSARFTTLKMLAKLCPEIPIIIYSDLDDKSTILEALKLGAQDYLIKDKTNHFLLEKAILYSIERKRLTASLRNSESRFRNMFEYSSIGIYRSTSSGRFIEVNQAFASIFGFDSPESIRNSIKNIGEVMYVNPGIRQSIVDEFNQQKIEYKQIETDFYRKDGSIFTGLLQMRLAGKSSEGDFVIEGYIQDITEQKTASKQMEDNIKFLRSFMDNIPSPVFAKDKHLKYTGCNKEFEKYIGFPEHEILGKTILDFKKGDAAELTHQKDLLLIKEKKQQVFETKLNFASGGLRDVIYHKNIIKDKNGEFDGIIGLILDITDEKQALDKLQEGLTLNEAMASLSKQLLKPGISILEISKLVVDHAKAITGSEHGYAGAIDASSGDLLLHTFPDVNMQDNEKKSYGLRISKTHDGYPGLWGLALNKKAPFFTNKPQAHQSLKGVSEEHLEFHNFLSVPALIDGRLLGQISLANSEKPYSNKDLEAITKLTNLYSLAIDKQKSVEELVHAKENAEQSDKLKSAFLANMSHEIRTPLNAIVGFAQMLGEEGVDEEETREFKGVIIKNTDILLRLINDIIEMSMIEAGEIKIHSESRSVEQTIRQIFSIWEYNDEVINSKGKIKFLFESPDDKSDKSFKIDDLRFNQITDNLLLNAFRFTEKGSITMGYYYENDKVVIYIRDTGVGISEEYQKSIFERFRQVDELRVRPFSGTGLGLAITKKLVEHLSGSIRIESQPGKGSTFFISFPLSGGSPATKPTVRATTKKAVSKTFLEGKNILIVEDNDSSFEFLEIVLQRRGAHITRAENGMEALEKTANNGYDIILMDLQLPEMDGFEAIEQIRKFKITTPIIVQTAFSEASERTKAFEAGCDAYLVKPITKNKLEEALSKFC